MDASLVTRLGAGLTIGLLTGALFNGSLWVGVALVIAGAPLAAAALYLARFVLLVAGLYAAVRFGAPALLAASAACIASRRAAQELVYARWRVRAGAS